MLGSLWRHFLLSGLYDDRYLLNIHTQYSLFFFTVFSPCFHCFFHCFFRQSLTGIVWMGGWKRTTKAGRNCGTFRRRPCAPAASPRCIVGRCCWAILFRHNFLTIKYHDVTMSKNSFLTPPPFALYVLFPFFLFRVPTPSNDNETPLLYCHYFQFGSSECRLPCPYRCVHVRAAVVVIVLLL